MDDSSVDVVMSNCVINSGAGTRTRCSPRRSGRSVPAGRLAVSDIVLTRPATTEEKEKHGPAHRVCVGIAACG